MLEIWNRMKEKDTVCGGKSVHKSSLEIEEEEGQ
jgi:hypothetical protein